MALNPRPLGLVGLLLQAIERLAQVRRTLLLGSTLFHLASLQHSGKALLNVGLRGVDVIVKLAGGRPDVGLQEQLDTLVIHSISVLIHPLGSPSPCAFGPA